MLQHVGLAEYVTTALETVTEEEVTRDVEKVLNDLKFPFKAASTGFGIEESDLPISSRHYLAMKKIVTENNFDALAIRCWPEVRSELSCCCNSENIIICNENTTN